MRGRGSGLLKVYVGGLARNAKEIVFRGGELMARNLELSPRRTVIGTRAKEKRKLEELHTPTVSESKNGDCSSR